MAVLPKGGISVAGHKIPWEAIAALAGVAGVILIIRARHQGSNVAAVGQAPAATYTAADSGFGAAGFTPDYSAALANLSQQLTGLQQAGINATPAPPQSFGQVTSDIGGGHILSAPNPAASVLGFFSGSPLTISGAPVSGVPYGGSTSPGLVGVSSSQYIPVAYAGGTGYLWAPEAHING